MLTLDTELIELGFEGYGYYSDNEDKDSCIVLKEDFKKEFEDYNFPDDLENYWFSELDGKYADVEGDYFERTITVRDFILSGMHLPEHGKYDRDLFDVFPDDESKLFTDEYRNNLLKEIQALKDQSMIDVTVKIPASKKDELLDFIKNL